MAIVIVSSCESVSQSVSQSQKSLKEHHKLEITGYGPVWSHMVLYGLIWSRMVLNGTVLARMVQYGPV